MRDYSLVEKISLVKESLNFDKTTEAAQALNVPAGNLYRWIEDFGDYVTDSKYTNVGQIADAITQLKRSGEQQPSPCKSQVKVKNRLFKLPNELIGKTVVEKLEFLMLEAGLRASDISRLTGMSTGGISKMLSSRNPTRPGTIKKFLKAFPYSKAEWTIPKLERSQDTKPQAQEQATTEQATTEQVQGETIVYTKTDVRDVESSHTSEIAELKKEVKELNRDMGEFRELFYKIQDAQISLMKTVTSNMQTQQSMLQFQQTQRIYNPNMRKQDANPFNSKDYQAKLSEAWPTNGNK